MKRSMDVLVSALAILLLSPILIPVVIGLKLTGEGYIFYFQERVGHHNRLFNIWKFATMLKDSPNMKGGIITTTNDPRITPMGGFLRKTKINELPQLFNVLFGHMSFVGPRPVMEKSFAQYPPKVKAVIYRVRPGITGIGSLIFRNEEALISRYKEMGGDPWDFYKNAIYPYKGQVENWYQQHQSFWTDLKILFLTAMAIVVPEQDLAYKAFPSLPPKPENLSNPTVRVKQRAELV